MTLNILQCHNDCKSCVLAYSKKHKLKKGDTFDIVCNGIPKDYVTKATAAQLQSPFDAEILLDPVKWAAEVLDWHCLDPDGSVWERKNPEEYRELMEKYPGRVSKYHRPYQATMLRCLHGDTHVFMADGTVKEIKDIKIGDKVVTYNENRKKTQSSYRVVNKWLNGVKPIYRVELENGDVLKVTSNHPILSWFKDGKENQLFKCKSYKRTYKSLDDGLSVGDKVYTLNQFNIFGSVDNLDLAKLLGYIVTDGYVSNSGLIGKKHVVEFRNTRYQYVEEFASLVASVFNTETPKITYHPERVAKDGSIHKEHWSVSVYNRENPLLTFLRDIGCFDKYTREISIANFAFKFSEQALAAFINRVWSGDGCVYVRKETHLEHLRATLTLSSGNEKFLRLFRLLLKKIGVYSSRIYTDIKKLSGTNIVLSINRIEDIERLLSFTGPIYGKEEKSILALEETGKRIHWNRKGNLGTLSRTKIKSIELIGEEPVYDIEVETRHNFIAEGVVVHNCTAKRKIFRIGRQAGKCLPSGTLIQMADGTQKPIELVNDGDLVISMDDNYRSIKTPAFRACNGEKPVARITLMDGRSIEATYNHPFLTRTNVGRETTGKRRAIFHDEWKPVEELTDNDYIAVPRNIKIDRSPKDPENNKDHLMTLLGCLIADGNITDRNCRFSNTNETIIAKLREAVEYYGCELKHYDCDAGHDYHIVGSGVGKKHQIKDLLRDFGLQGLDSHEKFIPDSIMSGTDFEIAVLLRAMFGCDGWAAVCADGSVEIGYSTVSEKLATQIVALLARFGVYCTMQAKTATLNGKKFYSRQLTITRKESIANFRNLIGILGKEEAVERVYQLSESKNPSPKTEAYEDNDIVFIKIKSIEHVGTKMTWDLSVPETKNFIANNILTHNTETLIISILYHLFVNDGFKIVLITPYQAQIDLIFKRIEDLIQNNPTLQNSVKRSVKAPQYTIELYNNSQIKGFTAGSKSGGGAGAARGQCLAKGTEVRLFNGLTKKIEDIKVGDTVASYNNDWESVPAVVTHVFPPEEKELFKLITASGREIELSKDHKLFTVDGERALKDIGIGDLIAIPKNIKTNTELSIDDNLIKATAYLIGDGYISTNKISFCSANPVTQEEFMSLFPRKDLRKETKPGNIASDFILRGESKKKLRLEMEEMGLLDSHSWNKFIPNSILSLPQEKLSLFLSRLYSTDGWASSGSNNTLEIGYCTTSKKLADDLVYLLSRFGIVGRINKRSKVLDGKHCREQYIVSIKNSEDIQLFVEKIGIYGKEDAISKIKEACSLKDSARIRGTYACSREFLITTLSKYGFSYESLRHEYGLRVYSKEYVSIDTLRKYASLTKIPELLSLLDQDVFWDRVVSINSTGIQESFDIEVKSTSKFIADGIVVHNSANMLVFDEADYLNPDDMDAAMSIITNFPNATVWMSSTPSGKREKFYDAAHSKDWKEYHFPSSVNPNWSEELEKLFRSQLTEIGYTHEVEAEFGSQEEGVFQVPYVEAAQQDYKYSDFTGPKSNWIYAIGVDWNSSKNGTTICVTGFNSSNNKFYVVERAIVQRANWTQLEACQRIAELNRKWRPFAIYVDKGFGATQIEVLHKFGYDARRDPERGKNHADSKLPQVVKPYEFGGTIETRDPFTKQKIKKPAKGFLVENSVRRFEARDIWYPKEDTTLTKELLNYIVKNVTQTGQVVYGVNDESVGDHNLDALMLSLVAFTLEKTPFGNIQRTEKVEFATSGVESKEEENWIPVNREKASTRKEELIRLAPPPGRGDIDSSNANTWFNGQRLPASNINPNHSSQPKIINEGWLRDEPAPKATPKPRSIGRGNVLSRGSLPKRSTF